MSTIQQQLPAKVIDLHSAKLTPCVLLRMRSTHARGFYRSCNAVVLQYPGLAIPFAHSTNFECSALIQGTYTAGLSQLKQSVVFAFADATVPAHFGLCICWSSVFTWWLVIPQFKSFSSYANWCCLCQSQYMPKKTSCSSVVPF